MTGDKPSDSSITSIKIAVVDGRPVEIENEERGVLGNYAHVFTRLGGKIYKIAQQLMDKHYCLNISDLETTCIRTIKGAAKRDILDEIHRLERGKFLFDGNALTGTSVLENATRQEIRDAIVASPGINFSRLRYATGKGNHLLAWHLSVLEKFGHIRAANVDGSLAYFQKDAPPGQDVFHALLHKPGLKEMLVLVSKRGKMKSKEIEFALNLPHATAFRRLRKLVDQGFVQDRVDTGHDATWYEVHPAWIEPIRKLRE